MALARNLRTLIVLGAVASLMVTGAIWAHQAVAQAAPECPPDWPNQQYAGPLREEDHGRIQYEDYHTDTNGQRWYTIRSADSNGYTTIRAYPASDDGQSYQTDSPDQVCYLIVRKPGATEDAVEPEQVVFPREQAEHTSAAGSPSTPAPTPELPAAPEIVPNSPPMLTSLEVDGEIVSSNSIVRSGLSRGQEVQITLQVSDADGGLAYLALVAEDGTELDRVDCTDGMEQECTLTSTLIAPSAYSATLRFRVIAVDDAGTETELATIALTTRARPSSTSTSGSGSGSSGSGSSGTGGGSSGSGRVRLEIEPPEQLGPFIADIPAVIYPVVSYTGRYRLYFTLPQAPEGMVIDRDGGAVTWTPTEDDEGQSFDVTVAVTDGRLFEEATFEITEMDPQRIRSSLTRSETAGNVLEITDPDTNLEGLSITSPEDEPPITVRTLAELQKIFELAPEENIPKVPDWITPLTDVFVVKGAFETPVELRLPIGELVDELPEGVQFTDVNLYAYAEISEVNGLFWTPVSVGFSFEGTDMDDLTYIVSLEGMQGLAFFGFHLNEPAMPFEATPQNISRVHADGDEGFHASEHRPTNIALHYDPLNPNGGANPIHDGLRSIANGDGDAMCESWAVASNPLCPDPPAVETIDCQIPELPVFSIDNLILQRYDDYRCTYDDDPDVEIWVKGFGEGCRWEDTGAPVNEHTGCSEGQSMHDMAAWLFGAQSALDELGLGYNNSFTVHIHPMSLGFTPRHLEAIIHLAVFSDPLGFVSRTWFEGRNVLHITDDNSATPRQIKFIALHEFFHHAQGREDSKIEGSDNDLQIDRGKSAHWISEGTATWFPDEVDDTLDFRGLPRARIMEAGLDSAPLSDDERHDAYGRFPFYDLMSGKCGDFYAHVKQLLNVPADVNAPDPTGVKNLLQVMADSDCDFGDHLDGEDQDRSDSMEAAIAYYNYATQFKDESSLLDANDPAAHFDAPDFDFDPSLPLALPSNLSQAITDGISLIYELSFSGIYELSFSNPMASDRPSETRIPSTGAYSARVPNVSGRLPENAVAELIVVPTAGDLIVSIAADKDLVSQDDFNAMNTIGPDSGPSTPGSQQQMITATSYPVRSCPQYFSR